MCLYKSSFNLTKKTKSLINSNQSLKTKSLLNISSLLNVRENCYNIGLPEKFVNLLMKHGKKSKAYTILYQALTLLYVKNSFLKMPLIKTQYTNLLLNRNNKNIDLNRLNKKNKDKSIFMKTLFLQAIENVQPNVEVRSVKVSGRTYQVPSIIYRKRQQILAMRWIIDFAKKRKKTSNNSFSECLALELFEALKKSGKVKQKRDMLHQQAESNRAYMRFKWW